MNIIWIHQKIWLGYEPLFCDGSTSAPLFVLWCIHMVGSFHGVQRPALNSFHSSLSKGFFCNLSCSVPTEMIASPKSGCNPIHFSFVVSSSETSQHIRPQLFAAQVHSIWCLSNVVAITNALLGKHGHARKKTRLSKSMRSQSLGVPPSKQQKKVRS